MKSIYQKETKKLIFEISEDIDECTSQNIRRKLDNEIEKYMPKEVIFDFNNVSFMDSAGIGLIIGRYKLANMLGGKVQVSNLTGTVRKIFEMSGILKIIPECTNTEKSDERTVPVYARTIPKLQMQPKEPSLFMQEPSQKLQMQFKEPSPLLQEPSPKLQREKEEKYD